MSTAERFTSVVVASESTKCSEWIIFGFSDIVACCQEFFFFPLRPHTAVLNSRRVRGSDIIFVATGVGLVRPSHREVLNASMGHGVCLPYHIPSLALHLHAPPNGDAQRFIVPRIRIFFLVLA